MPYTSNPYAPRARKTAILTLKKEGLTCAEMARRMGVHRSTIGRWLARDTHHYLIPIETHSSAPKHHPNETSKEVLARVVKIRKEHGRCAVAIHRQLKREGVVISEPTVKRILKREGLTRKKKQARYYTPVKRPPVNAPGDLVQIDTIHFIRPTGERFYIYAVIDLYSRFAWAYYSPTIGQKESLKAVRDAEKRFGFKFKVVQSDNGPEFRDHFAAELGRAYTKVRHSRIRTPNDNAHVERFIRTIQEECLGTKLPSVYGLQEKLNTYLQYYNQTRLHLALDCLTPLEVLQRC